ncbi:MAG TPA: hypothetical protein ENK31_06030, partial [Nannocystis exedens]|nr:hypothetical protein [Nannocystis exedens]
ENELQALLAAFERVSEGRCELAVATGAPGIGKSALVRELYGPITRQRGFFISGKFDQFHRNVPYSSLLQAFRALVRQLLADPPDQVETWRDKMLEALGPNGQILIRVIPEIELIIGPQPDVPELRSEDAQNRFNLTFRSFIRIFTQSEHPLVLFLDDVQWADHATLELLETLLCSGQSHHLLVVFAHRNNEVDVSHPLLMTIERIRRSGIPLTSVDLHPLEPAHVVALLGDTLHCTDDEVKPLADLLSAKTGGNPFFVGEFLRHLHDDGLLFIDADNGRWSWDLDQIRQRKITENVVELMSQKVRDLPAEVQETLKIASALGNHFNLEAVVKTAEQPLKAVISSLWSALQSGFLTPISKTVALLSLELDSDTDALPDFEVRFTHDRIQQAIYALIPEDERPAVHRRIGHHLLASIAIDNLAGDVFTIVGHLNQALLLVEGWDERHLLARLNLTAARRATDASAFSAAFEYFKVGAQCLNPEGWTRDHELTFALNLGAAESACMIGNYEDMEVRTGHLLERARNSLERATILAILIQAKTIQLDLPQALEQAISLLRELGVRLPKSPGKLDVLAAVMRTKAALAGKDFQRFSALPRATDPRVLAQVEVMGGVISAAYRSDPNSFVLIALAMLKLSVRHGNTPASGFAYACYALILAGSLGDVASARRLVPVCNEMLDWPMTRPFKAKTLFALGTFVLSWTEHPSICADRLYDGFISGLEVGDLEFASHCGYIRSYFLLRASENLCDLIADLEQMAEALRPLGQGRAAELCELYLQVANNLRGDSTVPRRLVSERFDINDCLRRSYHLKDTRALVEACLQKTYIE